MSSWAVLRVVTMTRGRVRLSTWPLRASVSVTARTATVTAGQLLTSTPPSCDSMITVAREERSAARLPSTVLPLPWDQRVLPTADPGRDYNYTEIQIMISSPMTAAAVSATPTDIRPV